MVREVIPLLDGSWKVTLLVSKCSSWRSYISVLVMESSWMFGRLEIFRELDRW